MEGKLEPKGVGGWLLILCFKLMILNPLYILNDIGNIIENMQENKLYLEKQPALYSLLRADIIFSIIVFYFSINAGWALARINKGAVKKVKFFFLIVIIYRIIYYFLPMTLDLNIEYRNELAVKLMLYSFGSILIWYMYLINSKRVKNTYLF